MELSAFVLAGGHSSRMGTDKALLVFGERTLLEHALALAISVAGSCTIVGARDQYGRYGEVIEDVFAGHGPLAGIHAALRSSQTDLNLVLAVDTPFVEAGFLRYLAGRAEASHAVVTVPRTGEHGVDHVHSLCAIYRRSFAGVAEAALQQGRNRIDALFDPKTTDVIEPPELARLGFAETMFRNLNTPGDLEAFSKPGPRP